MRSLTVVGEFDATEGAPTDNFLDNDVKPDHLHLIQPRGIGGRVMHVVTRTSRQPGPHFLVLMGGIVINYQMDVQFRRYIGLDVFEELQKFLMTVARMTPG
jgi:hypothetical protein